MCCLFGLLDCGGRLTGRQKGRLVRALALESEARGTDAAGIAYNSGGSLRIYKRPGPSAELLHTGGRACNYGAQPHDHPGEGETQPE